MKTMTRIDVRVRALIDAVDLYSSSGTTDCWNDVLATKDSLEVAIKSEKVEAEEELGLTERELDDIDVALEFRCYDNAQEIMDKIRALNAPKEIVKRRNKAKALDSIINVVLQCRDDDHEMIERALEEMGWEVWCHDEDVMFISRGCR